MDILLSPVTLVPLFSGLAALIWIVGALRRIYRLARYFQLEGYDSGRYLRWLLRHKRERRYMLGTAAVILLLLLLLFTDFRLLAPLTSGSGSGPLGVIVAILGALLGGVLLLAQPRDVQIKQRFNRTNRALRLLITAFMVGAALPVYYMALWALNMISRAPIDLLNNAFYSVMAGALALALAPFSLPVANALMWPVEAYFRRYFMRKAKANLKRSGATVICITGSYGKTSTKHYLQHLLSARFRTLMTPKSFNTLMGISRVINEKLADTVSYDYFIVEADAYFVGENASICRLVEPQIGMVMTVGPMHLERLGSMENIAKAQYEVIEALPPHGVGVFNGDDPQVRAMAARGYPQTRLMVTHTGIPGARLEALNVRTESDGLHFDLRDNQTGHSVPCYAPLYGETNVTNILMAAVVALHLGMSLEAIALRAATLEPADHRMVRHALPDGTVIIDDAYSANPVGTKAALDVLALHTASQRRIVISSGMFELGALQEAENRQLGQRMAHAATDVILIGPKQAAPIREGLMSENFPADRLHIVNTLDEAIQVYRGILRAGDTLLMLTDLPDVYAS